MCRAGAWFCDVTLVRCHVVWFQRFDRYADDDQKDSILDEGIEQFYTELGVDTQVRTTLAVCMYCMYCIVFSGVVVLSVCHRRVASYSSLSCRTCLST